MSPSSIWLRLIPPVSSFQNTMPNKPPNRMKPSHRASVDSGSMFLNNVLPKDDLRFPDRGREGRPQVYRKTFRCQLQIQNRLSKIWTATLNSLRPAPLSPRLETGCALSIQSSGERSCQLPPATCAGPTEALRTPV